MNRLREAYLRQSRFLILVEAMMWAFALAVAVSVLGFVTVMWGML